MSQSILFRQNLCVPDIGNYYSGIWFRGDDSIVENQNNKLHTDVDMMGEDADNNGNYGSISVHKAIVLPYSPFLASLIAGNTDVKIILDGVSLEVISSLVQLLYKGECLLSPTCDVKSLFDLSFALGLRISAENFRIIEKESPRKMAECTPQRAITIEPSIKKEVDGISYDDSFVEETIESVIQSSFESCADDYDSVRQEERNIDEIVSRRRDNNNNDKFSCDFCSFKSKFWNKLVRHCSSVHPDREYQCKKCAYKASSILKVKAHNKYLHIGQGNIVCEVCGFKADNDKNMEKHNRRVHGHGTLVCEVCGFKAANNVSMEKHKEHIHGYGNWKFMNVVLQDLGAKEETLIEDKIVPKVIKMRKKRTPHQESYCCHMCQYSTYFKKTLDKHLLKEHNITDSLS